jgi:hypothetical protein
MRVFLENVPDRYAFLLKDGRKLMNVEQLSKALKDMEHHVFYHHVTNERNDFHNWIRDIVLDLELAEKVLNAKNPDEARKIIDERIAFIKSMSKAVKKMPVKAKPVKKQTKKK